MAKQYGIYIKHNVGYPSNGKYNVHGTGFYTDSITEIRKVAMDNAIYDYNHQLHDGPTKIILSKSKKVVEEVWFGRGTYEFIMEKPNGSRYTLDENTGRIKRTLK